MRCILLRLAVATVTFAIGAGTFLMSDRMLNWRWQPLPYCEVARNADWYHDTHIRVKARLIFGADGIYVFEDCDPVEALASTIRLEGTHLAGGSGYVEEVLVTGDKPDVKTAEAIIEGHFNGQASTGCWRPKFQIDATNVQLISSVTEYTPSPD